LRNALLIIVFILSVNSDQLLAQAAHDYVANTVIFKLNPEFRALGQGNSIAYPAFTGMIENLESYELKRIFPHHSPPRTQYNEDGIPLADLSLIYELTYAGSTSLDKVIHNISKLKIIEYAQRRFISRVMYVPNDSNGIPLQYHLTNIQAFEAWDFVKGDTNIVIGITDTGIDPDHPDLVDNIKYNYGDTIDGIDNDNDGFIDNYLGWDMADNDNDPTSLDVDHHGTRVAGIAAESTDNGYQGAGVAFKCKFLPIKIARDLDTLIVAGYEGIVYGADHGCQIINCSWGSYYAEQFEIDVINYATLTKDALVIAAAGNGNDETPLYPAAMQYVISVGATNSLDEKWIGNPNYGSTYNRSVDLCAPGENIYSTLAGGGFSNVQSGTSLSAPVAAGCAAIVKAKFPNYSAIQIGEQLKVTADVIDTLLGNLIYKHKLGTGRVNLFRAITDSTKPSIVSIKTTYSDGNDERFMSGDTISVVVTVKNYLAPFTGLFIVLSSDNPRITIDHTDELLGSLNTLDTVSNYAIPLTFIIEPAILDNESVELIFAYTDGGVDTIFEYKSISLSPTTLDFSVNDISTSLTNQGRIGYENKYPFENRAGYGFQYKGEQLIFEAGLMVGAQIGTNTFVSDNIFDSLTFTDLDFTNMLKASVVSPSPADFEAYSEFNDNGAGSEAMNLEIGNSVYAWSSAPNQKYILIRYRIINAGVDTLKKLFAGMSTDWDIRNFSMNRAGSSESFRMGYVHSTEPSSPFVGMKLLSPGSFVHYAIDNYAGAPGLNIFFPNAYSTAKKYIALSTSRASAGTSGTGNDVIDVVSSGPYTLAPNDTIILGIAMMVGDNLLDLLSVADAAQTMYDTLFPPPPPDTSTSISATVLSTDIQLYPNPSTGRVTLYIGNRDIGLLTFELFDLAGSQVYSSTFANNAGYIEYDVSKLKAGIYQYRIQSNKIQQHGKLVLVQ